MFARPPTAQNQSSPTYADLLKRSSAAPSVGLHIVNSARREEYEQMKRAGVLLPLPETEASDPQTISPLPPLSPSKGDAMNTGRSQKFFLTVLNDDEEALEVNACGYGSNAVKRPSPRPQAVSQSVDSGIAPLSARSNGSARGSRRGSRNTDAVPLQKMCISPSEGTSESFSRRRIREVKSLRDQLMTTAGRDALNARLMLLDANKGVGEQTLSYGPDAEFYDAIIRNSSGKVSATKMDALMIQNMVQQTKVKNSVDQTWPIFVTPGFQEVMGPDNIYVSNTKRVFTSPSTRVPSTTSLASPSGMERSMSQA